MARLCIFIKKNKKSIFTAEVVSFYKKLKGSYYKVLCIFNITTKEFSLDNVVFFLNQI